MKRLSIWFASILRKWASNLSGENAEDESQKSNDEKNQAKHNGEDSSPITGAIKNVGDSVVREYRESRKEEDANERKNRAIAWFAVIFTGALAGVGIWQACLTRQANVTGRQALTISER